MTLHPNPHGYLFTSYHPVYVLVLVTWSLR
jgi:hypothetical protein